MTKSEKYDPVLLAQLDAPDRAILLANPKDLSEDEKSYRRKLQNRVASINSRQKKQQQVSTLAATTQDLQSVIADKDLVINALMELLLESQCVLARAGAYENNHHNSPAAQTSPIDHKYAIDHKYLIHKAYTLQDLIPLKDWGLKSQLLDGLDLCDPPNAFLHGTYIHNDDESDETSSLLSSSDDNGVQQPKRMTRSQAAKRSRQSTYSTVAVSQPQSTLVQHPSPTATTINLRPHLVKRNISSLPSPRVDDNNKIVTPTWSDSAPSSAQQSPTFSLSSNDDDASDFELMDAHPQRPPAPMTIAHEYSTANYNKNNHNNDNNYYTTSSLFPIDMNNNNNNNGLSSFNPTPFTTPNHIGQMNQTHQQLDQMNMTSPSLYCMQEQEHHHTTPLLNLNTVLDPQQLVSNLVRAKLLLC